MRILTVIGTRPQLIKEAALQPVLRRRHHETVVDTGQHYDPDLATNFFEELGLATPDHSLQVGSDSHATQVARIMSSLEPIMQQLQPDLMIVFGDTNSTLAATLVGAKGQVPVAHVEAGLRSFDRGMPEEVNRVATDHLSTWLFAPTPTAVTNLASEGITKGVFEVGDVMQDLAAAQAERVRDPAVLAEISTRFAPSTHGTDLQSGSYLFATVHRAENRTPESLPTLFRLLDDVAASSRPVIVALHPGTAAAMKSHGVRPGPNVFLVPPVGHRTSLALQLHAAAVLTDSGGVQREAAWLGTPCLVLRDRTEWVETTQAPRTRSVIIGLDSTMALEALDEMAPPDAAASLARDRASQLDLRPAGAAETITSALEEGLRD